MATITLTSPKKPTRHPRAVRWLRRERKGTGILCLRIQKGRREEMTVYRITPLEAGEQAAVEMQRLDELADGSYTPGDTYHVALPGNDQGHCDCRGFYAHGHCKHLESLVALERSGGL